VPRSHESISVTGYSSLGCPFTKTVLAPRINNEKNFSASVSDKLLCTGDSALLQLHDRNNFDIYKDGDLIYSGHDSSAINIYGDTIAKALMVVGKTPFGCRDTQWLSTPALDNWMPFTASVDRPLVCTGDSAILTISGRPKFNVTQNLNTILTGVPSGEYKLPGDSVAHAYKIQAISNIGCIDHGSAIGPKEEHMELALQGELIAPPFCDGDSVEVSYTGPGSASLQRDNQNIGAIGNEAKRKVMVPAANEITIQAQYTSVLGCKYESNILKYQSDPIPAKPAILRQGDSLVSSAATGNRWYYFGGKPAGSKDTGSIYTPDSNGAYFVKVMEISGCSNQSDTVHFQRKINTGSTTFLGTPQIQLLPNPFTNNILIRGSQTLVTARILGLDGKVQRCAIKRLSNTELEILAVDVAPGIYIAEVILEGRITFHYKIIKLRD
jgi:hypothetical protein